MTLTEQLTALRAEQIKKTSPVILSIFERSNEQLIRSGIAGQTLKEGQQAPDFHLPNTAGQRVGLGELLALGPVVISFYRGAWCGVCTLELRALQEALPQITAQGATLVALSPQSQDHSRATIEKGGLTFPVLSDIGNHVARQFGLVFEMPESLRKVYERFGIALAKFNGDRSFELPIPGTFVIDTNRRVLKAFADPDYGRRLEPAEILTVLRRRADRYPQYAS